MQERSYIDDNKKLESYFNSPEIHLNSLKSLYWLLDETKREFKSFDLSDNALGKKIGIGELEHVLKRPCLLTISSLCLCKLGLTVVPDVHQNVKNLQMAVFGIFGLLKSCELDKTLKNHIWMIWGLS